MRPRPSLPSLVLVAALSVPGCAPRGPCPADMAPVPGLAACIDRYEASLGPGDRGAPDGQGTKAKAISRAGAAPAVKVSQLQARAACALAGKRLCRRTEWTAACTGGDVSRSYPYGPTFEPKRCSDLTLTKPRGQVAPQPTGSASACRTPAGVHDLSGNVWEWLGETRGVAPTEAAELIGGGFANDDAEGLACTRKHPMAQPVTQQRPEIGFRCCADARPAR